MRKTLFVLLLLFAVLPLAAQKLPERGEVRSGNRQYNKGNYERSAERYNRALELDPANFEATYNLGNAQYKMERYEAAEQTLVKAAADSLHTDEERAQAFYNLGNAQFKQEKLKEALQSYKNSLLLNPSDMEAKYNYAYTKKLLDDQEQNGGDGENDQNQDQNQD
ncbi:MAG: tetratricopeptide repeat protein, partial [Rikenellaceae bacterium]|nr:tetratricopeptide repeat protein [Rikenellaceae bacterium]